MLYIKVLLIMCSKYSKLIKYNFKLYNMLFISITAKVVSIFKLALFFYYKLFMLFPN
jgi:hypothetical protein